MALRCPICSQQFTQGLQCPRCRVLLAARSQAELDGDPVPPHWSRNPWGRTILGVMIAQGLYYAFRNLAQAGQLAAAEEGNPTLTAFLGMLSVHALQVMGAFLGGFFAGAGQKRGGLFGGLVGVWNAIFIMLVQNFFGEFTSPVMLYALPIIHVAIGCAGGVLGSWFWRPPALEQSVGDKVNLAVPLARVLGHLSTARIHWFRILMGVAFLVAGYFSAETVLRFAVKYSDHVLSVRNSMEESVLTLEITALACFLGGALAGATTRSGAVQGGWVGIISVTIFVGMRLANRFQGPLDTFALLMLAVVLLSFVGGSFGGRLFPPLAPKRKLHSSSALAV
jgi:hypothetical protein